MPPVEVTRTKDRDLSGAGFSGLLCVERASRPAGTDRLRMGGREHRRASALERSGGSARGGH
jgi:hypothetical protein